MIYKPIISVILFILTITEQGYVKAESSDSADSNIGDIGDIPEQYLNKQNLVPIKQELVVFNFTKSQTEQIQVYQFYSSHPRELIVELQNSDHRLNSGNQQRNQDYTINIFEFPTEQKCIEALQKKKISYSFSLDNLVVSLTQGHSVDHIRFIDEYYYIVQASINLHKIIQIDSNNNIVEDSEDQSYSASLIMKFLQYIPNCDKNGEFDETERKCICFRNRQGSFCQFEVQYVTNYYPFEIQVKPFDGRYIQIYKISLEDEIKLELNIKHSQLGNIVMYKSQSSLIFPTQYEYSERLSFNSTSNHYIIKADQSENSIVLFIRNPSNSYLTATLNVRNITLIDETNIIFFIMISLIVTLAVSFLCIFCFNKISNGRKRSIGKHQELQETKESDHKEGQNLQNGTTPSTNRNLIEEIKTQRENQIKSEMEQITKGNKYEQFQMENSFKEQICAICLDDFEYDDVVRKTKCNHMFHEKCLYKWLFKYISCPMCNQDLT